MTSLSFQTCGACLVAHGFGSFCPPAMPRRPHGREGDGEASHVRDALSIWHLQGHNDDTYDKEYG